MKCSEYSYDFGFEPDLELAEQITGSKWTFYWGDKKLLGLEGTYQLMMKNPYEEGDFWWWHMDNSRQWYDNRRQAVKGLIDSFRRYRALQN